MPLLKNAPAALTEMMVEERRGIGFHDHSMAELDAPQPKSRRRSRWYVWATLIVVLLCSVPFGWNYYRVAAVQNALVRDYEITFDTEERPSAMPKVLDEHLEKFLKDKRGTWSRENPDIIYGERVRAMFRGRISEVHIYYHEGFRDGLGPALLRFPGLRKLTVFETDRHAGDYRLLCQSIRQLRNLEELELGGAHITNGELALLAGHPKLKKLNISYSVGLTTDVLGTLKELPALQALEVGDMYGSDREKWKSPAVLARFRKELPGVTVMLPQP